MISLSPSVTTPTSLLGVFNKQQCFLTEKYQHFSYSSSETSKIQRSFIPPPPSTFNFSWTQSMSLNQKPPYWDHKEELQYKQGSTYSSNITLLLAVTNVALREAFLLFPSLLGDGDF